MRQLVITADDFGADVAINEAVERAHREGVLTAASLMVAGAAAKDAVARAKTMPGLRVGLHLVLTDGQPVLPPDRLPALTGRNGRFGDDMVAAGFRVAMSAFARRQLEAEIDAQFAAFAATGLSLDHANAHRHFHLHPAIAHRVISIGSRYGLRAMRSPLEPSSIVAAAEPGHRPDRQGLVDFWAARVRGRIRRAGMASPDQVFGLRWSGAMTTSRLAALVAVLPEGLSEIYLHPAIQDNFEGSTNGYRYADELAALTAPSVAAAIGLSGAIMGGFSDFAR